MGAKHFLNVILGFAIISCGPREKDSKSNDQISGSYVREFSFIVTNPESGKEIGRSTIRDTIFIEALEKGYEVSNRKWKLNDYDREGWQSMEHSEDRPLRSYEANFVSEDSSLRSKSPSLFPSLYVDLLKATISKSQHEKRPYKKVR